MSRLPLTMTALLIAGAILALLATATPLPAGDPPHWVGAVENIDCTSNCHVAHNALGGGLNPQTGNTNLCQSCHSSNSLPIDSGERAIPGVSGTSHGFDVSPTNPTFGADTPANQEMALRLMEGNVVCSTCHNQHAAESTNRGRPRVSDAQVVQDLGGTGTMAAGGTFSGPVGVWYLIDITATGTEATARFRYSKDNGISWAPTDCAPGNLGTCLTASTSPVALDNGVEVTFTGAAAGSFQTGEQFEFTPDDSRALVRLEASVEYREDTPFWVYVDRDDETINAEWSERFHAGFARFRAFPGGSHSFDHAREALEDYEPGCWNRGGQ